MSMARRKKKLTKMGIFSWSSLTAAIGVFYAAMAVHQLYQLMNPLYGIEVDPKSEFINPAWLNNQKFSIYCFLSHSPRPAKKFQELIRDKDFLWEKHDMSFNKLQNDIVQQFQIISKTTKHIESIKD